MPVASDARYACTTPPKAIWRPASKSRWLLEGELKHLGVDFTRGEMWKPCTVVFRGLYTGQNPASAAVLAERLIKDLT